MIKISQIHFKSLDNLGYQSLCSERRINPNVNLLLASDRSRNPNSKINALVSSDGVQNIGARFALKWRSEAYLTKVKHVERR